MSNCNSTLTAERLREVLNYNPETGIFTWREAIAKCCLPGKIAGSLKQQGYVAIRLFGVYYKAHRLAWLHVTGAWPTYRIDHLNGVRNDNRWNNLRDVPQSMNAQNRHVTNAASGYTGVRQKCHRFEASIRVEDQYVFLGMHSTAEEANEAVKAAKRIHHPGFLG